MCDDDDDASSVRRRPDLSELPELPWHLVKTGFVGTKTLTLMLKKGTYRFYCTVHPTVTGTFKVT
jgi:hypothetical protein